MVVPSPANKTLEETLREVRTVLEGVRGLSPSVARVIEEIDRVLAKGVEEASTGVRRGSTQRLREKYRDAERNQFLSSVCHDLRDPLAAIMMGVGFLLRTTPDDEGNKRARKMLEAVQRSGDRMNRIVRNVADYVRIEGGRLDLDRQPHEAAQIARDAVEKLPQPGSGKSIRLEVTTPEGTQVVCDRDRTLTALEHLLANAVKYTPDGGTVTLKVERSDGMIAYSVIDTGPGISSERMGHLFEAYWHARQTPRDGTGLGLAIAHGIAVAQGGTLAAKSAIDVGSTFTLRLPSA
jgi:signal transduction histidine kinase